MVSSAAGDFYHNIPPQFWVGSAIPLPRQRLVERTAKCTNSSTTLMAITKYRNGFNGPNSDNSWSRINWTA